MVVLGSVSYDANIPQFAALRIVIAARALEL
jgi:hypothetical protein